MLLPGGPSSLIIIRANSSSLSNASLFSSACGIWTDLPTLNTALQHPKCRPVLNAPDAIEAFKLGVQFDVFFIEANDWRSQMIFSA